MRISTSKSETVVFGKRVMCPRRVGGEILTQVEAIYLEVLFSTEGRIDKEIDRLIGAASALVTRGRQKEMLWSYRSISLPTLTYGQNLWLMIERTRLRIQADEIRFLRELFGYGVRLAHLGEAQSKVVRMPRERLHSEVFCGLPPGRGPTEDPGHAGETVSWLALESPPWKNRMKWLGRWKQLPQGCKLRCINIAIFKIILPRPKLCRICLGVEQFSCSSHTS